MMNQISLMHAACREGPDFLSSPQHVTDLNTTEWRSHNFATFHVLLLPKTMTPDVFY